MKQLFLYITQIKQGFSGMFHVSIRKNMRHSQMKTLVLTLICFCSVQLFYAQEEDGIVSLALPIRNSLTFNRYIVNPTFSFVREQNKYISAYNKREWVQFDDAPQTYLLGYSGRFAENMGAGLGLFQQDYGVLTTFGGILNFAYNAQLTRDNNLTFGINLGVYKSGLNTGKVITNFDDPSLNNIPSHLLLTANPGINYGTLFMDFGVSINNLVLYNVQSSELIQDDPRQSIQAHVMYTGYMNGRGFFNDAKFSGLVRSEIGKDRTTFSGVAMITSPKGIWAQVGFNSYYGGSAGLGLNITEQIAIEYNFEKAMGDMTNFGPSHDITLAYKFKSNTNYKYHDDDDIGSIFSSDNKRVLASSQPKMDTNTRAQLAVEAGAKREEIRERAKEKEETRVPIAADTKANEAAKSKEAAERVSIAQQELEAQSKERLAAQAAFVKERIAAQEKARADAKAKVEEKLRLAKEAKAKADQEAKEKFPALERANALARAKAEEDSILASDTKAKADQEAKDRLAAQEKAKADALAKTKASAKLAADAKSKADQEAKDRLVAQEKVKADALAKAEASAKLAADAKAKADQEAKDRLAAQEKAKADALAKAETSAKLAADAKSKADQEAKDKLAAQEKAKADALAKAEASAKLAADGKAKADQEAKDRLAAQEKAKADALAKAEASAKMAADAKAKADQEAKDKLAAQEKAKADASVKEEDSAKLVAQEKAKPEIEAKTINTPTDAIGISMKSLADSAEASKIAQDELLAKFNEAVAGKEKDLQDLKEENDLSERGIVSAPKAFKSITDENNKLAAIRSDLENIIKTNNERIKELDNLYKERIKVPTLVNDEVTLYYQKSLQSLKAEQSKAIQTRSQLSTSLKKIDEETEFERKRRIKRAVYTSEEDRYLQDRAMLRLIKQRTTASSVPLKVEDFDFGEKQGNNIQIIKNVDNVQDGYYAVVAVHTDVAKRDNFITKAVSAGASNIDFFYDVNTSKYFIYYKKDDSVATAMETLKTKGSQPYNGQMSIIKIEN